MSNCLMTACFTALAFGVAGVVIYGVIWCFKKIFNMDD